ncbi:hypothetical protein [Chitinasiproducens palmae]|nr:hypothetical protein [Chitinasiproducens palmae]
MNTPAATPAPSSATQAPPLAMPDLVRYRADLEEMQRLRRTNEVLRLRLENQKLEAGLAKLNSGAASIDADDADSLQGALTNWVGARGDAARAQIWLRGQGTLQIVTGDLVGNGWRVAQISANGVVLQRKGRRYVLPFGTAQAPSTTGTES